jgi:hypothetical protein
MSSRRRGTTMIELLVYMGLLTSGMLVLLGIEAGASRALALQQALLDVELESGQLLGQLRRDVEAAARLEVDRDALVVHRQDGRTVRYVAGARVESGAGLQSERREAYRHNTALTVSLEGSPGGGPLVIADAAFVVQGTFGKVERAFRRSAAPRARVGS